MPALFQEDGGEETKKVKMIHRNALRFAVSGQPMDFAEARTLERVVKDNQNFMEMGNASLQYRQIVNRSLIRNFSAAAPLLYHHMSRHVGEVFQSSGSAHSVSENMLAHNTGSS
jgi:hypothetical protein